MIKELATGLGVTLENLFKKPFTVQYPEEKLDNVPALPRPAHPDAARGRPRALRRLRAVRGGVPGGTRSSSRGENDRRIRSRTASATPSATRSTCCAASSAVCARGLPQEAISSRRTTSSRLHPPIRSSTRRPSSWCDGDGLPPGALSLRPFESGSVTALAPLALKARRAAAPGSSPRARSTPGRDAADRRREPPRSASGARSLRIARRANHGCAAPRARSRRRARKSVPLASTPARTARQRFDRGVAPAGLLLGRDEHVARLRSATSCLRRIQDEARVRGSAAPSRGSCRFVAGSTASNSTVSNAGARPASPRSARSTRSVPFFARERRPFTSTRSGESARRAARDGTVRGGCRPRRPGPDAAPPRPSRSRSGPSSP